MGNKSSNHHPGGRPKTRHVPVMSDVAVASALSAPAMLAGVVAVYCKGEAVLAYDTLAYIADHIDLQLSHLPGGKGVKLTTVLRPGAHVVEAPPTLAQQEVAEEGLENAAEQPPDVPPGLTHSEMLELDPPPDEPSVN